MKFAIVVHTSPDSRQAATTAYQFASTLLQEGHEIYRLFFLGDGVGNANCLTVAPQDESNLARQWHELISNHELDSMACVSSALRHGVLNAQEAQRHDLAAHALYDSTELAGLGQLVDAAVHADRLVQFG